MRKFNKALIIIGLSIILLIPTVIYAANYFNSIKSSSDIVNDNNSLIPNYTIINSYEELVANSLYDEDLSNSNNHSNPKFLQFNDNIRLFSDLVIYTDVNVDLNEKTLDLNGHNLTFKNSYYTNLVIENGTITNSKSDASKLTFDLPNGIAAYEGVIDANPTGAISVVVANQDSNMVLNNALNYAVFKLYGYNYGLDLYRNTNYVCRGCQFTHDSTETCCVYAISDLEFIDHLYGYDIEYSYESSDTAILTNKGRILTSGTVKLIITASIDAETSLSRTIYVHSLATADYNKAALSLMLQYFEPYYDSENSVYNFSTQVLIPKKISYLDVTLGYTFYDSGDNSISGIIADSLDTANYYVMTVSSAVKKISITATKSETSESHTIGVAGNAVSNIVDKNTIARQLVSKLVGNQINITKDSAGINGYTKTELSTDVSEFSAYVSTISYSLVNNSDNIYKINSSNILHVNPSGERLLNPEESLTSTAVICTVTFKQDCGLKPDSLASVDVSVPIKYLNNDGEQAGLASFRPYYVQYDKWINLASGGYTINSFEFRGTVGNDYPIIYLTAQIYSSDGLLIAGVIKDGGTYPVYSRVNGETTTYYYIVDNVEIEIDGASIIPVSDIIQFSYIYGEEEIIDKNNVTAEMVASGNLKCKVTININYVLESISTVALCYQYKMNESSDWTTDGDFVSYFDLLGIFRCGENERFTDQTLFNYIKGLGAYGSQKTDYFDTKLLINGATFDVSGKTITSFKGLEAFKNVTSLNASNSGFTINDIQYVAKMDALETLIISNNNLTDYSSNNMGFPTGTKTDFISELSTLKYLTTLDVSNNKIYDFSGLANLPAIKTVYLQNNLFEHTISFFGFTIDIGAIVNRIYGSKGALNTAVYTQLLAKQVDIYNDVDTNGNPKKFESEGDVAAIYKNLTNVEYQNKLANGVNIEKLFESYCTYDAETGKYYSNIQLFNGGAVQSNRVSSNNGDKTVDGIINSIKSTTKSEFEYVEFRCNSSDKTTATQFEIVYHYTIFVMESGLLKDNYEAISVEIIIPYQVERY